MLITLQSNSDADCNDFRNFFKETVMIEPKSEIALVNISYNFESGITLTALNNTFTVKLAKDVATVITIPIGDYTPASFLTAIQTALNTFLTARPYEIGKLFKISATADSKNVLTIEFDYDPQEWQVDVVKKTATTDRQAIILSNTNAMSDSGDGIILQTSDTAGLNLATFESGSGGVNYPIWATASDTVKEPHGSFFFTPQQDNESIYVCLAEGGRPTNIATAQVQVRLLANGTYDIFEDNGAGGYQSILSGPAAYDSFIPFEIRVEQIGTTPVVIRYFYGGTEIIPSGTASRWLPRLNSQLICCGSFDDRRILNGIVPSNPTYTIQDCILTTNSSFTGGSGYITNEVVEITATGGNKTTAHVTSVDGTGAITQLRFLDHGGGIAAVGESMTIIGKISGSNNGVFTAGAPADSVDITTAGGAVGTGYTTAAANIILNDGVTVIAGAVTITAINGTDGVDDFSWNSYLPGQVLVGDILTIDQGTNNDCKLLVNAVDNDIPSLANVKWTTIAPGVDEPLIKQSNVSFIPGSGFATLTTLPSVTGDADPSLKSVGTTATTNQKETDQMLVNIEEFQLKSICKNGGIQKAVASVPYGQTQNPSGTSASGGYFFHESYNLNYHQLENAGVDNHNQLRVRLTDAVGEPLLQLKHPTTLTLDLRPRAK